MDKVLVIILAGRGPDMKWNKPKFETFHSNDKQDVVALYNKNDYPNWQSPYAKMVHNGQPFPPGTEIFSKICNVGLDYAEDNGYEKVFIVDDNCSLFYHYHNYTKENLKNKDKLTFDRYAPLPEIEMPFGGFTAANFKRFKISTGAKYSHQMPVSSMYWNIPLMKEKIGLIPRFDENTPIWPDYDYYLNLRKLDILPHTFNRYAFIKPDTQDQRVKGKSLASKGDLRVCTMGYNLYKRYGSENCICKKKTNFLDVSPAMKKKFFPVVYRYRVDTLEHFLKDAYDDHDTLYIRESELVKKGNEIKWTDLFADIKDEPKKFRFGAKLI
jgi:hypothetical protein